MGLILVREQEWANYSTLYSRVIVQVDRPSPKPWVLKKEKKPGTAQRYTASKYPRGGRGPNGPWVTKKDYPTG